MTFLTKSIFLVGLVATFVSCQDEEQPSGQLESVLAGGATTIFSSGPDAFTFPLANLDQAGVEKHFIADGVFGQQFVSAPADQFGGIGPLFNQNSCEGCHVRNGRGIVPQYDGDPATGLLLRLSVPGQGLYGSVIPAPGFGGQLQHKAIFNAVAEGKLSKTELTSLVTYLDGESVTLTKPVYNIIDAYIPLPPDLLISPRLAPPVHGLGLIEAIPEEDILSLADEHDLDGDGISGRPNRVWNVLQQQVTLGRFGWKAENPTAGQQAADAARNDMGLTSYYFPDEHCEDQSNCTEGLQTGHDVDDETTDLFAFYFQTVAVPAQRDYNDPDVKRGRQLFEDLQCAACHTPKHVTGSHPISSLAYQTIYPYTDLLLHDMGEDLSDHRPTYQAEGQEWRTPPLWGIGLTQVVNPKATFLHDGRAKTLEEAILWHGGEAEASREQFKALTKEERIDLISFLEAL